MSAVLGIDAAWTPAVPTGFAVVGKKPSGWQLIAAAASYQRFLALADGSVPERRPTGSLLDVLTLPAVASALCSRTIPHQTLPQPLFEHASAARAVPA